MPRVTSELHIPDHGEKVWILAECYRYYAKQRRLNCTALQLLDLWVVAPYCEDCGIADTFEGQRPPDINAHNWQEELAWKVGRSQLFATLGHLRWDETYAFTCRHCLRRIRPWFGHNMYVVQYHLEEHYGIPLEAPGRIEPSRALRKQPFRLYDFRCFACNKSGTEAELHIDHVRPRSLGGDAAFRNLQPLCEPCGELKGAQEPVEVTVRDDMYFRAPSGNSDVGLFW